MSYGLIATLIVLVIVVGAITTKKCEAFLIAGWCTCLMETKLPHRVGIHTGRGNE